MDFAHPTRIVTREPVLRENRIAMLRPFLELTAGPSPVPFGTWQRGKMTRILVGC